MSKFTTARLMSPIELGQLVCPNRVAMAPMTRARAGDDRIPNGMMATYYAERASAGLLIAEATTISKAANGWVGSPGIYTDAMVDGWRAVTDAVHQRSGRIFLQLWHCGRASHSEFHDGALPLAPSAIKIDGDPIQTPSGERPRETPEAMSNEDIQQTIADYASAAASAKTAGFDGVEIHAANGYLLDTFLQSKTNHRSDEYGGSIDNRNRMLLQVVDAVGQHWSADRIAVRIGPNGTFNDMGSPDFREQFLAVATALSPLGLGYLHVLDGLAFGFHELGPALTLNDLRSVYDGILMGNCGYDQSEAETRISDGDADMISFGRPYIANPNLVERFASGEPLHDDWGREYWYGGDEVGYTVPPSDSDQA